MHILRCKCNCYQSGKTPKIKGLHGLGSVTQSTAHLMPNGDKRGRRKEEEDDGDDDDDASGTHTHPRLQCLRINACMVVIAVSG